VGVCVPGATDKQVPLATRNKKCPMMPEDPGKNKSALEGMAIDWRVGLQTSMTFVGGL